jgi:hypothetical protein
MGAGIGVRCEGGKNCPLASWPLGLVFICAFVLFLLFSVLVTLSKLYLILVFYHWYRSKTTTYLGTLEEYPLIPLLVCFVVFFLY